MNTLPFSSIVLLSNHSGASGQGQRVANETSIYNTCNTSNAFVGIDTSASADKLDIEGGNLSLTNAANDGAYRVITCHSQAGQLLMGTDVSATNTANGPYIEMAAKNAALRGGQIWFHSTTAKGNICHAFYNLSQTGWARLMTVGQAANGIPSVVIGNVTAPAGYSLICRERYTNRACTDSRTIYARLERHCFAPSYKLMPLADLKRYISNSGHLPEIPTAAEVKKDGIDLAEMDSQLLQKVEELTLYVLK